MAKRDMRQTAAAAKAAGIIPTQYELTALELTDLYHQTQEGPDQAYSAIETAFIYGFVLGQRATKAKARRARKAAKEERLHAQGIAGERPRGRGCRQSRRPSVQKNTRPTDPGPDPGHRAPRAAGSGSRLPHRARVNPGADQQRETGRGL